MFWGFLFWMFFIFRPIVLADGVSVSWTSVPSSAPLNTQFDVRVKVTAVTAGTYYVKADNGSDCKIDMLYNESWSNSCNVGVDSMQSIKIDNSGGSSEEILRLRVRNTGSAGTYTLYAYAYDSNKTLLATSSSSSITINAITPTPTITSTPTPTPTSAVTSTSTPAPTKTLTPTPTSAPIIEPTEVIEPTETPAVAETAVDLMTSSDNSKKSLMGYLPIVFVILGLIMFLGPVFGPKILAKIKSRRKGPPQEPPQLLKHFESQQPTSVKEITSDGEDIPLER